ncbi:methyltransferase [Nonomuraea sp. NPDC001023]|uniref:methyltransferase n=1 Tax=unclassified Nonomuraea TaxID=2593643 RepID=UPI0033295BCA
MDIEGAFGRAELSCADLLHSVRTGQAAYPRRYGRTLWEDLAGDTALAASFQAFMAVKSARLAPVLAARHPWAALEHVVDVGGGDATVLTELLIRHPGLRGTLGEQPAQAQIALARLADACLAHRACVTAGSCFDPLPPDADRYLLCDVLHNWDDAAATAILRRCAEAAGRRGSVLVVDGTSTSAQEFSTEMDLRMLTWFGGRERTTAQLAVLAAAARLTVASALTVDAWLRVTELTAIADGPGEGPAACREW